MADISKCVGANCPIRNTCYRYTAPVSLYQTYAEFQYIDGKCDYYWNNEECK